MEDDPKTDDDLKNEENLKNYELCDKRGPMKTTSFRRIYPSQADTI